MLIFQRNIIDLFLERVPKSWNVFKIKLALRFLFPRLTKRMVSFELLVPRRLWMLLRWLYLDPVFFKCENWTHYARLPPERVNRFEWNFEGIYSSLSAFVRDMYRISFSCPPPKYFSHWTYMTLWGIVPLPVQGRNRKSKIAPCSRACWTLYTLQVSFKSTVQFRRRRGINLKKTGSNLLLAST